jgi:Ser/Thr protein kinase RdoA (MazF antagonist)
MGPVTDAPALTAAQTRAAGSLLRAAWGEPAGPLVAAALQGRDHVFRLRLAGDRSAVLKRRDDRPRPGQAEEFGIELATLEYLNAMPVPVAPRLLGADPETGIMVMEDLGRGPSLADSLLAGRREPAEAGLIAYARALGRLHAWSRNRPAELAARRARHAPGATMAPAWTGATMRGRDAFLGAAAGLGLTTAGVEEEIAGLAAMMAGSGYLGLVHSDACPDNVRLLGREGRIFDFETSGWGPVVLDAAYLLAPFPSCWCFGAVPDEVAGAALEAYRAELAAAGITLGPDWTAALAAAVAGWIVARGPALATAIDEDRPWGTTGMRPRLLAWLRAFGGAAGRAGELPRLRALADALHQELAARWGRPRVPEYPAFAGPDSELIELPGWWQPEG